MFTKKNQIRNYIYARHPEIVTQIKEKMKAKLPASESLVKNYADETQIQLNMLHNIAEYAKSINGLSVSSKTTQINKAKLNYGQRQLIYNIYDDLYFTSLHMIYIRDEYYPLLLNLVRTRYKQMTDTMKIDWMYEEELEEYKELVLQKMVSKHFNTIEVNKAINAYMYDTIIEHFIENFCV